MIGEWSSGSRPPSGAQEREATMMTIREMADAMLAAEARGGCACECDLEADRGDTGGDQTGEGGGAGDGSSPGWAEEGYCADCAGCDECDPPVMGLTEMEIRIYGFGHADGRANRSNGGDHPFYDGRRALYQLGYEDGRAGRAVNPPPSNPDTAHEDEDEQGPAAGPASDWVVILFDRQGEEAEYWQLEGWPVHEVAEWADDQLERTAALGVVRALGWANNEDDASLILHNHHSAEPTPPWAGPAPATGAGAGWAAALDERIRRARSEGWLAGYETGHEHAGDMTEPAGRGRCLECGHPEGCETGPDGWVQHENPPPEDEYLFDDDPLGGRPRSVSDILAEGRIRSDAEAARVRAALAASDSRRGLMRRLLDRLGGPGLAAMLAAGVGVLAAGLAFGFGGGFGSPESAAIAPLAAGAVMIPGGRTGRVHPADGCGCARPQPEPNRRVIDHRGQSDIDDEDAAAQLADMLEMNRCAGCGQRAGYDDRRPGGDLFHRECWILHQQAVKRDRDRAAAEAAAVDADDGLRPFGPGDRYDDAGLGRAMAHTLGISAALAVGLVGVDWLSWLI